MSDLSNLHHGIRLHSVNNVGPGGNLGLDWDFLSITQDSSRVMSAKKVLCITSTSTRESLVSEE